MKTPALNQLDTGDLDLVTKCQKPDRKGGQLTTASATDEHRVAQISRLF